METTVTPTQSSMVSGGPQARGTATKIKLESKIVRKRKKGEGGRGRKILPCGGGRAWPAGTGCSLEELLRWMGRRLSGHGLPRDAYS